MKVLLSIALITIATVQAAVEKRQSTQLVAFSVGLNHMIDLDADDTVIYNTLLVDTNNAYNNATGVYTVPTHGVYTFIYHGLSQTTDRLWLDLYKNSDYQITAFSRGNNDYASCSNSISIECAAGDAISIKGRGNSELFGKPEQIYCTFSGFLNAAIHGTGK